MSHELHRCAFHYTAQMLSWQAENAANWVVSKKIGKKAMDYPGKS